MIDAILRKIFGTKHERDVKRMMPAVEATNALEPSVQALGDAELRAKTDELRKRLDAGASVDELLPEAFAVARDAARRTVGMRPFDVQLIGGMVLHEGKIAEMATGEGKTLVATRSEEHTSELQSHSDLVCRLLLEKKKIYKYIDRYISKNTQ